MNPTTQRHPIIARAVGDHRRGLPGFPQDARGTLTIREDGLKFRADESGQQIVIPWKAIRKVLQPRKGLYPKEYVARLESQKKKVQAAGYAAIDPLLYLGAQAAVSGARQELSEARLGQPLVNRIIVAVVLQGQAVPVIFDLAGDRRAGIEMATSDFQAHLESILPDRVESPQAPAPQAPAPHAPAQKLPKSSPGTKSSAEWEPPGLRDRLSALKDQGHLNAEDHGYLMGLISAVNMAPTETKGGFKFPDLSKVDWSKVTSIFTRKPATPPATPAPQPSPHTQPAPQPSPNTQPAPPTPTPPALPQSKSTPIPIPIPPPVPRRPMPPQLPPQQPVDPLPGDPQVSGDAWNDSPDDFTSEEFSDPTPSDEGSGMFDTDPGSFEMVPELEGDLNEAEWTLDGFDATLDVDLTSWDAGLDATYDPGLIGDATVDPGPADPVGDVTWSNE